MKYVGQIEWHAERSALTIGWQRRLYFERPGPPREALIVLDLPDFPAADTPKRTDWMGMSSVYPKIIRYLSQRAGVASRGREVIQISADLWRPATLDDVFESINAQWVYGYGRHFTVGDFEDFHARHAPPLMERLRGVSAQADPDLRIRALRALEEPLGRFLHLLQDSPRGLVSEVNRLEESLDDTRRRQFEREQAGAPFSLDAHVALIGKLRTAVARTIVLNRIGDALVRTPEAIPAALAKLGRHKLARQTAEHNADFWSKVAPQVHLEPTETDIVLDLTDAQEVTVELGFDLLRARRIGTITPGRSALVLYDRNGRVTHYVRGERKLLHQLRQKSDGTLRRFGCTLTLGGAGKSASDSKRRLLDAETLDTLSHVDPDAALAFVEERAPLSPDHPARRAAAAAKTDSRQGRVLADLLLEEAFGIDADILRQRVRAQTNRR